MYVNDGWLCMCMYAVMAGNIVSTMTTSVVIAGLIVIWLIIYVIMYGK